MNFDIECPAPTTIWQNHRHTFLRHSAHLDCLRKYGHGSGTGLHICVFPGKSLQIYPRTSKIQAAWLGFHSENLCTHISRQHSQAYRRQLQHECRRCDIPTGFDSDFRVNHNHSLPYITDSTHMCGLRGRSHERCKCGIHSIRLRCR